MTTDKIMVYSNGSGIGKAMDEAGRFAKYNDLGEEESLYLTLLAEEMLGMVKGITGEFEGNFWLEKEDDEYRLKLRADTYMDKEKKKKLIALSPSGKNESTVGIMEMIKSVLLGGLEKSGEVENLQNEYDDGTVMYGTLGMRGADDLAATGFEWSLLQYRSMVEKEKENQKSLEAWDELEKSIIANIADDVKVGVRGDIVELTIIKHFDKEGK